MKAPLWFRSSTAGRSVQQSKWRVISDDITHTEMVGLKRSGRLTLAALIASAMTSVISSDDGAENKQPFAKLVALVPVRNNKPCSPCLPWRHVRLSDHDESALCRLEMRRRSCRRA